MRIRKFDKKLHLTGVRACLIELQDFERALDPRLPTGAEIVDEYIPHLLKRCEECAGEIFVAEVSGGVAGFVAVLASVISDDIVDGGMEYGQVTDVVVAREYRRQGIGSRLLEAAEEYAEANGAEWLRIGVLAENRSADTLYDSMGFRKLYIGREKKLNGPQ